MSNILRERNTGGRVDREGHETGSSRFGGRDLECDDWRSIGGTVKALIDIAPCGSVFRTAHNQAKAAESGPRLGANYHRSFESARALFAGLTPSRIDLLEVLHPLRAPALSIRWRRRWSAPIECAHRRRQTRGKRAGAAQAERPGFGRSRRGEFIWRLLRRRRSGAHTPNHKAAACRINRARVGCGATTNHSRGAAAHA